MYWIYRGDSKVKIKKKGMVYEDQKFQILKSQNLKLKNRNGLKTKKKKKELLSTDGMEEGARDYEMLFALGKADLAKKRAIELAKNMMS